MTISTFTPTTTRLGDLETLWEAFDELISGIQPEEWNNKHGKDWVYADVPYHLSYFDREIVARPIEYGLDYPKDEIKVRRTMGELNGWNDEMFALRPPGQTPAQSIVQMKASREHIRRVAANLSQEELERPTWTGLPLGGWLTAREALNNSYVHTWGHFLELRLRMKSPTPQLTKAQNRLAMSIMTGMIPLMADTSKVKEPFSAVMKIPEVASFTIRVAGGNCSVAVGEAPDAMLVVSQSPETMIALRAKMINPMLAMLTGKIKVKGMSQMGTFGKLLREPSLDQILPVNLNPKPSLN